MASFSWWFDFSCPYAYLSSLLVEGLAERAGATLVPEPMLLGGVFQAHGAPQVLAATWSPAKALHMQLDVARIAERHALPLRWPDQHPQRTVTALRALLVVGAPSLPLARRFFQAYWSENRNLGDDAVVAQILTEAGLDATAILKRAGEQGIKDELRHRTDRAVALGVFGAPTFFVDGKLHWGQDRMDRVERALGGPGPHSPPPLGPMQARPPLELWFDYSSPFAYVGFSRALAAWGPALRLRPMLLGAVFRSVGQVDVPLHAMHDARRAWVGQDLMDSAAEAGVPLQFNSHFPVQTTLPLRMTLLAGPDTDAGRAFARQVYRAIWVDDVDPRDPLVMRGLADELGLDGAALVEAAGSDAAKAALRAATAAAVDLGIFGAPAWVVRTPGQAPSVFWGNDRLELAAWFAGRIGAPDPSAA